MMSETFSKQWFDEAFSSAVNNQPYDVPANLRRLAERICRSYGIRGVCDPMYIANVAAFELGLGDGYSRFGTCASATLGPDDLIRPCILSKGHEGFCGTGR